MSIKRTKRTKSLPAICWFAACLMLSFLIYDNANAQNFENKATGVYQVGNAQTNDVAGNPTAVSNKRGIIRMRGTSSANGEINGMGANNTTRIPGTVIWGKNGNQTPQKLYYTNLGVQNPGTKTFESGATPEDGYHVSWEFLRYKSQNEGTALASTPKSLAKAEVVKYVDAKDYWVNESTPLLANIVHECETKFWYDHPTAQQYVMGTIQETGVGMGMISDNVYSELYLPGHVAIIEPVLTGGIYESDFLTVLPGSLNIELWAACDPGTDDPPPPSEIDSIFIVKCVDINDDGSSYWTKTWYNDETGETLSAITYDASDVPCDPTDDPDPCDPDDPTSDCYKVDPCDEGSPAIYLGPGTTLIVDGSVTWLDPGVDDNTPIPICMTEGTCTMDATSITNTQAPATIEYTANANAIFPGHYGRLRVAAGARTDALPLAGYVFVKGKVSDAFDHKATYDVAGYIAGGQDYTMTFTQDCADAEYAACGEFIGWINREQMPKYNLTTGDIVGYWETAIYTGYNYTYHNASTNITLNPVSTALAKLGIEAQKFGFQSIPGVVPSHSTYVESGADKSDWGLIKRQWTVAYPVPNADGHITVMNLGYKYSEVADFIADGNSWSSLRGYEGYEDLAASGTDKSNITLLSGQNGTNPVPWDLGKTQPTDNGDCPFLVANQSGKILTTDKDAWDGTGNDISDSSQIIIANAPVAIYSIIPGRWSNPATWGGILPTYKDSVYIQHHVYTGLYDKEGGVPMELVGEAAWTTNEYDIPEVQIGDNWVDGQNINTFKGEIQLARLTYIMDADEANSTDPILNPYFDQAAYDADPSNYKVKKYLTRGTKPKGNADGNIALIVGNQDVIETNATLISDNDLLDGTSNRDMDPSVPLVFGTIINNASKDVHNNIKTGLTIQQLNNTDVYSSAAGAAGLAGFWIMGYENFNHPNLLVPAIAIATTKEVINNGRSNNEGILEIGYEEPVVTP